MRISAHDNIEQLRHKLRLKDYLPILVCRDPKSMKSAVMISFAMVGICFVTTFVCKILATEICFQQGDAGVVGVAAGLYFPAAFLYRMGLNENIDGS